MSVSGILKIGGELSCHLDSSSPLHTMPKNSHALYVNDDPVVGFYDSRNNLGKGKIVVIKFDRSVSYLYYMFRDT